MNEVKSGDRVEYVGSDGKRVFATVVDFNAQRRLVGVVTEGDGTPLWVPLSILRDPGEAGSPALGPDAVAAPLEEALHEIRQGRNLPDGLTEFPFPCEARYAGRSVRVLGIYRDTGKYLVRDYDNWSGENVYRIVVQEQLY